MWRPKICYKGSSGMGGGGGGGGGGNPVVTVKSGPGGRAQRAIVTEKDGKYQFTGAIADPGRVDTSSAEYKRALRDNNVKATFNSDGSVTVQKGGLYDRKRTFKSADAFQKDANGKLDQSISYNETVAKAAKSGRMTQLEMEAAKTTARTNPPAQAISKISKGLTEKASAANTRAEAARDMKRRLNAYVGNQRK